MIRSSRPARRGATRSRDGYVWREAVAGGVAACVVAAGAMVAGGIAGSGRHDGGASGRPAFTDSSNAQVLVPLLARDVHPGEGVTFNR